MDGLASDVQKPCGLAPTAKNTLHIDPKFFHRIKSSHFSGTVKSAPAAQPPGTGIKEGSVQLPLLVEQEAKSIPIGRKADELNRGARASREARPRATSDHARLAATIVDQLLFRIFPIS